ncbi:MAG TPA: DUF5134 domain-containing protein [Pseudonocardiaceae bacterium]|jgi:hypothetical protein|nr:DUF5134 domain-containing protein [Pseudonocardiaceae bacterium]
MVAGPVWVSWVLSSLLALVCLSCLARLAIYRGAGSRPAGMPHWHEDVSQLLMGLGMIAMLLALLGLVPKVVWLLAFLGEAVVFAVLLLKPQRGVALTPTASWQYVHHLMAGLAMAYVVLVTTDTTIGRTVGGAHPMPLQSLASSFAMYFIGYTVWSLVRVKRSTVAVAGDGVTTVLSRPRVVEGCRVVMGAGMVYMFMAAM